MKSSSLYLFVRIIIISVSHRKIPSFLFSSSTRALTSYLTHFTGDLQHSVKIQSQCFVSSEFVYELGRRGYLDSLFISTGILK